MKIFQIFFQSMKQEGHGYRLNEKNTYFKFWQHCPFRVAIYIYRNYRLTEPTK